MGGGMYCSTVNLFAPYRPSIYCSPPIGPLPLLPPAALRCHASLKSYKRLWIWEPFIGLCRGVPFVSFKSVGSNQGYHAPRRIMDV